MELRAMEHTKERTRRYRERIQTRSVAKAVRRAEGPGYSASPCPDQPGDDSWIETIINAVVKLFTI